MDEDIQLAYDQACEKKFLHGCSREYIDFFNELMELNGWNYPLDELEAKDLYINMCINISQLI